MGSFHESVLEKRSKLENGSSRTAAKRSITLVASKKLKKMFLEKSIEKNGSGVLKKSESLKMHEKSRKTAFLACFKLSDELLKRCLYHSHQFFKPVSAMTVKLARTL